MKIKQLVLISLIVFSLGCMGVLIAGLALPEGTRLGGPANDVSTLPGATVGGEQVAADGTPIITPHSDPAGDGNTGGGTSSGGGGNTGGGTSGGGSTSTGGGSGTSGSTGTGGTNSGGGTTTTTTVTPKPTTTTTTTPKPTTTTTVTPKPSTTTPPPAVGCGSPGGICSAAQVATHNSASNCWVIYNAGYYIVTSYVRVHPGGTAVFNSTSCGKDITSFMNGSASIGGAKHRHSNSAYTSLNSYYVGKVQ